MKIFLVAVAALALTSCASQPETIENRGSAVISNGTTNHYKRESPYINKSLIDTPEEADAQNRLTAKRCDAIAENVTRLRHVDKASVTINGSSCVVNIEISGIDNDKALIDLKNSVELKTRSVDKKLEHVAVTIAKELTENILDEGKNNESPISPDEKAGKLIEQLTPAF